MLHLYFEAQLEVVCVVGDAVTRLWKRLKRRRAAARGRAGSLLVTTQPPLPPTGEGHQQASPFRKAGALQHRR